MGKFKNLIKAQAVRLLGYQKPDPKVWVFSSTDNCHYNYNSRYLFEYVKENYKDITPLFVINDRELREKLSRRYGAEYFFETESVQGMRKALEAGVWMTSAGLPVYGVRLGKKRMIVNLWHGIPLKKIALEDPNLSQISRIYFRKIFTENYTCILTCSKPLIPIMAKSFDVPDSMIKVWGQPRNDMFYRANDRQLILKEIYGELPEYKKTILYAPTFRDYGTTELFPFPDFDREKLEDFLEKENILLFLRTHINEKGNAGKYVSDRIRYLGNEQAEDVAGILNIFDLLITDYSSIYIDYLLLDRPMVFLPYDKERYLEGRGMNFVYDDVTPGAKPDTMKEFMTAIHDAFDGRDKYDEERRTCNAFFNEVNEPCMRHICEEVRKYVGID